MRIRPYRYELAHFNSETNECKIVQETTTDSDSKSIVEFSVIYRTMSGTFIVQHLTENAPYLSIEFPIKESEVTLCGDKITYEGKVFDKCLISASILIGLMAAAED